MNYLHKPSFNLGQPPDLIPHDPAALAEAWRRWPEVRILPPLRPGETGPWGVVTACHSPNGIVSLHRSRAKARDCLRHLRKHGCCGRDWWWCRALYPECAAGVHAIVDLREGGR